MSEPLTSAEEDEWVMFELVNQNGKFAIDILLSSDPGVQFALERGFDMDWWRLIDICVTAHSQGRLLRVFKLTQAGKEYAEVLKGKVDARRQASERGDSLGAEAPLPGSTEP